MNPLAREIFPLSTLFDEHPPRWNHHNKQAIFAAVAQAAHGLQGELGFSRWPTVPLPADLEFTTKVVALPNAFNYSVPAPGDFEWHVNFADPELFGFYGSALFAQDEWQVAEHPALGALREALLAKGIAARTVEEGQATPVLITGVPRICAIETGHIYGNLFARASIATVRAAVTPLRPPTRTNIIAMAAPRGRGNYDAATIELILRTAFTAFAAARAESTGATRVIVHTGFWGCGAFGGNRTLMAALQLVAACMAHIDRLDFHAMNAAGRQLCHAAEEMLGNIAGGKVRIETRQLIKSLVTRGFAWGISDGN